MCGIAGYFGFAPPPDARLDDCQRAMGRRGPDSAGRRDFATRDGIHVRLLFARLAILDLSDRAAQPFAYAGKTIVFNGEIYNYVEMGATLDDRDLRTTSDTEILIRSIHERGLDDALDRAEGMWAFALFDPTDGSLTLSRDRFGEKPLYVYHDAHGLYFGSEIKFIRAMLGRNLEIDAPMLHRYLVHGYKSVHKHGAAFFRDIDAVEPGTYVTYRSPTERAARRYWTPGFSPREMTYAQAVDGARARLVEAVRLRLRADVPMAFCMSGGVDSNSLIAIAKAIHGHDVHGFTIENDDPRYDESPLVRAAVDALGLRHTSVPVTTADFLGNLRELVRYHDAPVFTITYYAHWLLMRAIREHEYKISISGTAADELFSGYYDHHLAYLRGVRNDPALYADSRARWQEHILPVVRNPHLRDPELFVRDPAFRGHIYFNADEFARALRVPFREAFTERRFTDDLLRNRMLNEVFYEAVPVILHEDDLNAMYYSIENRSPFLDRNLFEFCFSIPSRHLIRDGAAKAVLRDAMRGIVPDPILDNRRKFGFNAPLFSFLDPTDPTVHAELWRDSPIFDHLDPDAIRAMIERESLPNSESKFLFYFISAKLFLEEFA